MQLGDSEVLVTGRLRLEPLRHDHADEMVSVLSYAGLYEFTGGSAPTLGELNRRYDAQVAGPADGSEQWRNWIMRETEGDSAAGFVQATVVDGTADVAWLVGHEFQGQGFGVEAAAAMCEWLRSAGLQSLTAHIHPHHVASQKVASGLGMSRTGEVDEDGEEVWAA